MGVEPKPRRPARAAARALAAQAALWAAFAFGCFTHKPSGESLPTAAPASTPATPPPPPPSAAPNEGSEQKRAEPPPSPDRAAPTPSSTPSGAAKPTPLAPRKAAAKARRQRASEADAETEEGRLGGSSNRGPSDQLRQRLDHAYRASSPDCPSARERKKAVCDLAGQICQLIDRDPNVASVAEYCAQAKERCAEAGRRTSERCPE